MLFEYYYNKIIIDETSHISRMLSITLKLYIVHRSLCSSRDTRLFFYVAIEARFKQFKLYRISFVRDSRVFLSVVLFSLALLASRRNRCPYEIK